jgi:serine/threonine protein kinase/predicted ATPase/Tfp pilus assembly protein PilF
VKTSFTHPKAGGAKKSMSSTSTLISSRFQSDLRNADNFIGQGGMGTVYRGKDSQTGDSVAIKMLKKEIIDRDPEALRRFRQEGEALRQLNHPNIVKVLGEEEQAGVHYLVMEYVGGGSLRDVLDHSPKLSIQRALYIALDLADALTRAHRLNILHRDIKPANVLISTDGTPRLTDFGMARMGGEPHITQDGAIVGTMAYLAPEAFSGEEVDERSDIWAFGVMLYEMLAGERPFPQIQPAPLIQAIMTNPLPDLEALRPDVPTGLVDLIYRMVEKNRQARIPSVRLIGAELESLIRGGSKTLQPIVSISDSTGRFDLDTTEVPVVPGSFRAPHNLPNPPTPFVGRPDELEALCKLLEAGTSLITLTGPGGIGKSRIALALAEKQLSRYTDGVYLVQLAGVDNAHDVPAKIADAIGFSFGRGDDKAELVNYLREKQMLLVLDNFEAVMDAAQLAADIAEAASKIQIIISSRERLRLRGEHVFDVDAMVLPTAKEETVEQMAAHSVVKLFLQSARRVTPSFDLDERNVHAVAEIIRLVGGLPLGVELAAAWLEALPLDEIKTEIEKSLDFLETDLRDVPERHRSLRAVADNTWNLLTEDERETFLKLAVFRGGFEREAAQKVADASLRTLTNLVNKSLLVRDPEGRYRGHKLLQQYAEERLKERGDLKMTIHKAHAEYYALFATKLEPAMNSTKEVAAIEALDKEIENIRLVWRKGIMLKHYEKLDIMQDALLYYYLGRSMLREGYDSFKYLGDEMEKDGFKDSTYWRARVRQAWFGTRLGLYADALNCSQTALEFFGEFPSTERAHALNNMSYAYMMMGDYEKSIEYAAKSVESIKAADDNIAYFTGMGNMGYAYFLKGDLRKAREIYESLQKEDDLKEYSPSGQAYGKNNLGEILMALGDIKRAQPLFQEAYDIFVESKQKRGVAFTALNLAGIAFRQSDYAQAKARYEEGYALYKDIGDRWGIAQALSNLGNVAMSDGQHDIAQQKYQAALTIRRDLGEKRGIADSLSDLAWCAMMCKDMMKAKELVKEALQIRREIGDKIGEGDALAGLGLGMLFAGQADEARKNFKAALKIAEETGSALVRAQVYAGLGELAEKEGKFDLALKHYKTVLRENDSEEAPLGMILWALLGVASIKVKQGEKIAALQLVTLILRYPRSYISMIEEHATKLMKELTAVLDKQTVQTTMSATKSLVLKNFIAELLAT